MDYRIDLQINRNKEDRKYEDNSLNVWLLNEDNNNLPFDSFDGFEISINNEGQIPGVKLYNNDGLQNIIHDASHALGTCKFQYLDSDVPFTLRISMTLTHGSRFSWIIIYVSKRIKSLFHSKNSNWELHPK